MLANFSMSAKAAEHYSSPKQEIAAFSAPMVRLNVHPSNSRNLAVLISME
jgi:hypothetical protein